LLLKILSFATNGTFVQRDGNEIARPTKMMTTPEKLFQNIWGIEMNKVVVFRRSVNMITDTESDPITVIARLDICFSPASEAPITIGNNGNMQGATTVNTPAKIAMRKKIILLYLR
jgi:hypothetical protein